MLDNVVYIVLLGLKAHLKWYIKTAANTIIRIKTRMTLTLTPTSITREAGKKSDNFECLLNNMPQVPEFEYQ